MLIPLFNGNTEGLQKFEQMSILGNPGRKYFENFDIILLFIYFIFYII